MPELGPNLTTLLYLIAAVCFIMALRGLSSPVTARGGNLFGIVGMVIAIATTVLSPNVVSYVWILVAIVIGGSIGTFVSWRIQMTALPQLVAAFHSLVGLAAVFVAAAALNAPADYHIAGPDGAVHTGSLVEMGLGTAIGAITFTGSIIAFGKLQGLITGKPLVFPGQHWFNLLLGLVLIGLGVWFVMTGSHVAFWLLAFLSFAIGFLLDRADRRRGHAGGRLDAQLLLGLGRGGHRLHAAEPPADHHRRAGRLLGRDPQLHHVQGDEPLDHQRDPGRLRRRGRGSRGRRRRRTGRSSRAAPTTPPSS